MRWPWQRVEERSTLMSISDPVLAGYFGVGPSWSGVQVGESTALGLSAVWRAVSLISQTIASLPLRTLRDTGDGMRQRVGSFLDQPGGPAGPTPFEWAETVMVHLLLHGNAFLAHVLNGAGAVAALMPIHPLNVTVEWEKNADGRLTGRKLFKTSAEDGRRQVFTDDTMTHIPALCTDGLRGLSPITVARNSLGMAVAGDRAAARMFSNGAMISGIVTPEEDVDEGDAKAIRESLNQSVAGYENAGTIALVNRRLKFTPWTMTAADAQFLESRQFSVEEIARWFGLLPIHLAQTEKQTSWGTGVAEQHRGLGRFTLSPWAHRIEQRLSRLLPSPRFVEFDFAGLERGSPEQEIDLLIRQVEAGLLTLDEARAIRNLPPLTPAERPADAPDPAGVPT